MLSDLFCEEGEDVAGDDSDWNVFMSRRAKAKPKPPLPRAPSNFVGLENQGATCYLNALLQCMYLTPELRGGLFSLDPMELGAAMEYDKEPQVECKVPEITSTSVAQQDEGDEEPPEEIVDQLLAMGFSRPCAHRCAVSTKSSGSDHFSAALEHALQHSEDPAMNEPLPEIKASQNSEEGRKKKKQKMKKARLIPLELQRLFSQLQGSGKGVDRQAVSTQELTERGFQWTGMDGSVQHDAHELNRLLIDALEKSLKNTKGDALCRSLYRGLLANQIECLTCNTVSEREEHYYDLLVQVLGATDLRQALSAYIEPELLNGENRYECDICQCRTDSHRRVVLKTIPPVLTFSCQRFDIDRSTWQRVKVANEFRFPLAFSMQSFLASNSEPLDNNNDSQSFIWLDEVYSSAQRISTRLINDYGEDVEIFVREKLSEPESELYQSLLREMCHPLVLTGESKNIYQLFAVINHHGSAYSGHYSAYVRDVLKQGVWHLPVDYSLGNEIEEEKEFSLPKSLCWVSKRLTTTNVENQKGEVVQLVLEHSPLHIVLCILLSSASADSGYISLPALCAALESNVGGKKWSDVYQADYGDITSFLQQHSSILDMSLKNNSKQILNVRVQSKMKYNVMSLADFKKEAAKYSSDELKNFYCPHPSHNLSTNSSSSNSVGEIAEWQTKGKKKRKNGKGHVKNNSEELKHLPENDGDVITSSEELLSSGAIAENIEFSSTEKVICEMLMTTFHGTFFNFNDSAVTPIPVSDLRNSFEGSSSAYILIYRNISLELPYSMKSHCGENKFRENENVGICAHINGDDMLHCSDCACPMYWQSKVDILNSELQTARHEYDTFMQTINLTVYFPIHFSVSKWPVLQRPEQVKESLLPSFLSPEGLAFSFDSRKSVDELRLQIIRLLQELWMSDDENCESQMTDNEILHSVDISCESDQLLSTLQECPRTSNSRCSTSSKCSNSSGNTVSMYMEPPLAGESQVGNVLADHASLFLWASRKQGNPSSINNHNFEVYSRPPKRVFVSFPQSSQNVFFFPLNRSLSDICRFIVEKQLSSSFDCPSLRIDSMRMSQSAESHHGKSEVWETQILYSQNKWKKTNNEHGGSLFWGDVLLDDFYDEEIFFDVNHDCGMNTCSAEGEASRRNRLWTIQVKYEDEKKNGVSFSSIVNRLRESTVSSASPLSSVVHSDATASVVDDSELLHTQSFKNTFNLDIDCEEELCQLKKMLYFQLLFCQSGGLSDDCSQMRNSSCAFPPKLLRQLQFRTGHNPGVGLLDNENFTLKDLGLYNNVVLRLEDVHARGEEYADDETVTIRFCVVSGNDYDSTAAVRSGKHNPQKPGSRSLTFTLRLDNLDETIFELKRRALSHFMEMSDIHDDSFMDSISNRRLRKTNWADECSDELLYEVARRNSKSNRNGGDDCLTSLFDVTVGSLLRSGSLKDNELLLLEDGELPDRDSLLINVLLWPSLHSPQMESPPRPVSLSPFSVNMGEKLKSEFEQFVLNEKSEEGSAVLHPDLKAKLNWLPIVGKVKCCRHGTLHDLYKACYDLLAEYHENLTAKISPQGCSDVLPCNLPPSPEYLLLRDLHPTSCLPGKQYRIPSSSGDAGNAKSSEVENTIAMIGKAGGGRGANKKKGKGGVHTGGAKTLQRLGFKDEGNNVVLQLLEGPQSAPLPSGQIRVWVQVAESTSDDYLCAWPPREVVISGGVSPSFGHLLRPIAAAFDLPEPPAFGSANTYSMDIFKYVAESATWMLLSPGLNNQKKKGTGGRGRTENVLAAPYSLVDGSFLVLCPRRSFNNKSLGIDRKEDMFLRFLRDVEAEEKRIRRAHGREETLLNYGTAAAGRATHPIRKETEIMLKIGDLDLNFSDDEDGDSNKN